MILLDRSTRPLSRKRRSIFLCVVVGMFIIVGCGPKPAAPAGTPAGVPTQPSSTLPYDVDVQKVRQLDASGDVLQAQREFDILAWQTFIALNWPATEQGTPDNSKTIADATSPRVWQSWRLASTIFLTDGDKPEDWGPNGTARGVPTLYRIKAAWRQHGTSADQNFQAFSGPLVDQNGKWVRYEVLVNREEFDYLYQNGLYNQEGQVAFSQRESGNQPDFPINIGTTKHGAIEIKFAWKELGANDDRSKFYTTQVKVKTSEKAPEEKSIDVGLVGMHIAMKTESSPEWIWATFEHVDNAPDSDDAEAKSKRHNFYSPPDKTKVNLLPSPNATDANGNKTWFESLTKVPVEVERMIVPTQGQLNPLDDAIRRSTKELNAQVQGLLKNTNSVFQNYELIGTQWPIHPNAPAFAGGGNSVPESITHKTPGDMVPVFLVNTTMETYFQKGEQKAGALEQDDRLAGGEDLVDATMVNGTESCVGCHYSSGICIGFKKSPDGSYTVDSTGHRIAIYGENSHFGKTGNANFSWLLQIEAKSKPYTPTAGK